jgi:exonuclease SbcD
MQPFRLAHISDTHLGYRALFKSDPSSGRNQRAVDVEQAYEIAIGDILTRDVQLVIHAGDVFHHTRPTWAALRSFVRQTRRLTEAGIPVVVIGGNHDTPRLRTSGSVFSVMELALPGVRFVCDYEQETVMIDELELALHAVPHGKLASPIPPSIFPIPGKRNVLMTHGLVSHLN